MAKFRPIPNLKVTHEIFTEFYPSLGYVTVPSFRDPSKVAKAVLPEHFMSIYETVKNMETFEDDVFVCGHPKSGTNWLQEMVWLLNSDLDYEEGARVRMKDRFLYLEGSGVITNFPPGLESIRVIQEASRPRFIKTHLLAELLPDQVWSKNSKIFFIARNPKDIAASYLHFSPHFLGYKGTKEQFFDAFLEDQLPFGGLFDQLKSFWAIKDLPNVMFLHYEDMKRDLRAVMKEVSKFLGKSYSEEEYEKLAKHLSLDSMRKNPSTNWEEFIDPMLAQQKIERNENHALIRKGGSHKEDMSPELIVRFDQWTKENLKDSDFRFKNF